MVPHQEDAFERSRNRAFLNYVADLKHKGYDEQQIALDLAISVTQLREFKSVVFNQERNRRKETATTLKKTGVSNVEIAKRMGLSESTVRSLLDKKKKDK